MDIHHLIDTESVRESDLNEAISVKVMPCIQQLFNSTKAHILNFFVKFLFSTICSLLFTNALF